MVGGWGRGGSADTPSHSVFGFFLLWRAEGKGPEGGVSFGQLVPSAPVGWLGSSLGNDCILSVLRPPCRFQTGLHAASVPTGEGLGAGGGQEKGEASLGHTAWRGNRGSVPRRLHLDDPPMSLVGLTMQALHGSRGSWVPTEPAFGSVV